MEFEGLLKGIGDFGRYQWKLTVLFMIPTMIVIPWFMMEPVFIASTPKHWCRVDQMARRPNLSVDQQQTLIRPDGDPWCSRYDINYSQIVLTGGNWSADPDWTTIPCDNGWHYDTINYDETATTKGRRMEFEGLLKKVGDFGRYQWTLVVAYVIPTMIVVPWFILEPVFIASTPDHWCYVDQIARAPNMTLERQQSYVRPHDDPSCSRYDVNYTHVLVSGNWSVDPDWRSKTCDDGWSFDTTNYDETATTKWNLVCKDSHYASLILSLIFLGDVIGTPFYGFLSDKLGRRPTFFILALVTGLTEIASVTIPNFTVFVIMRTINGAGMSTIYAVPYIIALELVGPSMRARMNGIATTSWTVGMCILPLIAWLTHNWIWLGAVNATAAFSLLLFWKILPESPSWLISQEKYEAATGIMQKIGTANGKTAEETKDLFTQIKRLGDKMKKEKMGETTHSPADFLRYPQLRKKFFLVAFCWMGNQVLYFGIQMNVRNLSGNEFVNFFLISLVEIPSHLGTWFFMERLGRRWCSVCAFAIGGAAYSLPVIFPIDLPGLDVAASLIGKMGSSSTFMTLYQQSPELFPTPLRSMGIGMSSTVANLASLSVPYIVYLGMYGKTIPFTIFTIISLLAGTCAAFLPETLNENLPQTIADAEKFGIDQKFFSCAKNRNSSCSGQDANPGNLNTADDTYASESVNNGAFPQELNVAKLTEVDMSLPDELQQKESNIRNQFSSESSPRGGSVSLVSTTTTDQL